MPQQNDIINADDITISFLGGACQLARGEASRVVVLGCVLGGSLSVACPSVRWCVRSLLGFGCFSRLALCGLVGVALSAQGLPLQGSRTVR